MSWRSLIGGLVLGFGLGWAVFGPGGEAPSETVEPLPRAGEVAPPRLEGATAPSPAAAAVEPPATPDWAAVFASGDPAAIHQAVDEAARPYAPEIVRALLARLAEARRGSDWRVYRQVLYALGHADTPEADAELVRVLGDEELTFPEPMGGELHRGLKDSETPGIVEAARRRLLKNHADGDTSWVGIHGWVNLVADHGTEEDIRWLLDSQEAQPFANDGAAAVAASSNPVCVEWMREALTTPSSERRFRAGQSSYPEVLRNFVRSHEEEALDVVTEILRRQLAGESVVVNMKLSDVFRLYGQSVPSVRTDEAVRFLQALTTEARRVAAVYAASGMKRRDLDVTGLESVLDAPVEALRRMAGGVERPSPEYASAYRAMYAIEYNPAIWSEEAAAALEAAADGLVGTSAPIQNMRDVAKEVRAGLRSPWRPQ